MQPSQKQLDILEIWEKKENNIVINAVAGSGKTTLLMMLLEKCDKRTLFVAFNKSIQEEIQSKIDSKGYSQGKAMTMHSLGLLAIKSQLNSRVRINGNKNWKLIQTLQKNHKRIYKTFQGDTYSKVNFSLIDMLDASRTILSDDYEEIENYLKSVSKSIVDDDSIHELWYALIELRDTLYEEPILEIDFLDMIYLPAIRDLSIPIYSSYLFVDECQDLNLAQHKIIDKMISEQSLLNWVAVGDKHQAIYGFSGASTESFNLFTKKENVVEMPLDICYRCPKKVIEKANEVYDIVFPGPTAIEGIVENVTNFKDIKDNSMVICRNTAPIFELYFKLLGEGKSVYINGADILQNMIKFLKGYIKDTIYSATREMSYKLGELEEAAKSERDADKIKYYIFKENFSNFLALSKHLGTQTDSIQNLLDRLKVLFEDKENAIMLCTIHKSKGLEADVVYILNESTTIPSKFAITEEQLVQEKNLKYVARTRAKKELYFLNIKTKDTEKIENVL